MGTVAFIPARANSKRIPGKNYQLFNGKPLIYWTIKAAIEASSVDFVLFSTEDESLGVLANDLAFKIDPGGSKFNIIKRDPRLSQDHVQTDEVFTDMLRSIEYYPNICGNVDTLVLLQPPSPMRTAKHIDEAVALWGHRTEGCLISGHVVDGFYWKFTGPYTDEIEPIGHDPRFRLGGQWIRRYEKTILENGAIYICSARQLSLYRTYRRPPYIFYEMEEMIDIDTKDDMAQAAAQFVKSIQPDKL